MSILCLTARRKSQFIVPARWLKMGYFQTRLYTPLCPSVGRSVTLLLFLWILFFDLTAPALPKIQPRNWGSRVFGLVFLDFILWPHCSYPNALVTSSTAPAHPHATGVAVYLALFFSLPLGANCAMCVCGLFFYNAPFSNWSADPSLKKKIIERCMHFNDV